MLRLAARIADHRQAVGCESRDPRAGLGEEQVFRWQLDITMAVNASGRRTEPKVLTAIIFTAAGILILGAVVGFAIITQIGGLKTELANLKRDAAGTRERLAK